MDKKYAIFDLDGTLVDSMPFWKDLSREYLIAKGVKNVPADILERIKPMTVRESARLFIDELGLAGTVDSVSDEINGMMGEHYKNDIPIKPGVESYLKELRERGVNMCVASATVEPLIDACLERLGVRHYFNFSLSCDTVGAGKSSPLVYQTAAARLGARVDEAAVYEDSLLAATTAKNAGFYLCVVADAASADSWDKLCRLADEALDWEKRNI